MTLLPAIPTMMLGAVLIWFVWPNVVDMLERSPEKKRKTSDADTLSEDLFEVWKKHARARGFNTPEARS